MTTLLHYYYKWPLTVGSPSTRAGRRTDIIKPGYPETRVWRPSNPETQGFKKASGFAFPTDNDEAYGVSY